MRTSDISAGMSSNLDGKRFRHMDNSHERNEHDSQVENVYVVPTANTSRSWRLPLKKHENEKGTWIVDIDPCFML